jgi:hypothetical protein
MSSCVGISSGGRDVRDTVDIVLVLGGGRGDGRLGNELEVKGSVVSLGEKTFDKSVEGSGLGGRGCGCGVVEKGDGGDCNQRER